MKAKLLSLSFIVILTAWTAILNGQDRDAFQRFKALDINKDGKVNPQEAGKAAWVRYERMDSDGDGSDCKSELRERVGPEH